MKAHNKSAKTNLCAVEDLEEFIRELNAISESTFCNVEAVLRIISSHPVNPDSLASYLTWDAQHYTRNLIYRTDLFALMAICWEPGQSSSIHNHQNQNCWMAVPVGRLLVENFRLRLQNIEEGRCELEPSGTFEMNSRHPTAVDPLNPVHRVYNPRELQQRAVSLHVYSRPFDECAVYSEQGTCGLVSLRYTTEYGKRVDTTVD